jgi:hypothetical protein
LLASCSTKVSHADSAPQSPSEANILPDITGGKRKHVNGVEGSGGNDKTGCRRTAGTDLSKTSSSLEYDGFSFLPNIGGTLLASGSTKIQLDFGGKLSATGGRRELGRSKGGIAQDLGTSTAAPQSPRCSFVPNIGGTWLATGSSKIHMTSAGRDPVFPQGPAHETGNMLLDIGGQLPVIDGKKLPAAGGESRLWGGIRPPAASVALWGAIRPLAARSDDVSHQYRHVLLLRLGGPMCETSCQYWHADSELICRLCPRNGWTWRMLLPFYKSMACVYRSTQRG